MKEQITGAVTYPKGFKAAGIRAGIKEKGEDMALIVSDFPAAAAGVFSKNVVRAACVEVNKAAIPSSRGRAILANSGNANSYTGAKGYADALATRAQVARLLDTAENEIFIASTGVIGHLLPMDKMTAGINLAAKSLSQGGGADAARAIMTTDTRPKEAVAEITLGGVEVRIGGIAKGSGMICPNMATMLSFVTTDLAVKPELLQECLSKSVEPSYNCLTVDGDSSTNDMVLILANGAAGNSLIESDGPELREFQNALDSVTKSLARQLAADGEGATKLVEITVSGTATFDDARQIAKTIANSPLVKTAMFGKDPNWGRVFAAAGRAGVDFDPTTANLYFAGIALVKAGEPVLFDQEKAHEALCRPEVAVLLEIGSGPGSATVWTCDFSYDYVRINAEYHT